MSEFNYGPFPFKNGERISLAGERAQKWHMYYGDEKLAETFLPESFSRNDIVACDLFSNARSKIIRRAHEAIREEIIKGQKKPDPVPFFEWIQSLLPAEILTQNHKEWRAPTPWEIRHVISHGSFTGVTVAKAAALVGITPQSFRRYLLKEEQKYKQNIPFSLWHLLLYLLDVKKIYRAE